MSEIWSRDFSRYDSMITEGLEEILRLDIDAPDEKESDIDLVLCVMDVLANRKKNSEIPGKTALKHLRKLCVSIFDKIERITFSVCMFGAYSLWLPLSRGVGTVFAPQVA